MKRLSTVAVVMMLGMMPWAELHAQQTAQTTFMVKSRVQAVCEVTASDLDFGPYTAQSGTPLQGTTLLRATCTPNTVYSIGLSAGTSPGATVNQRRMIMGTQVLNYQLYTNSSRTRIWGITVPTNTVWGVGTGQAQDHTVYGSVPAGQIVPAGDYADTITVYIYY